MSRRRSRHRAFDPRDRARWVVGDHITGTLELHVNDVGAIASTALPETCADLGVAELASAETVFCVVLVDAAGHRGDGDCTAPISLE